MEVNELFKEYKPIKCIYETGTEYICIPDRGQLEPVAVFYDKSLKQYNTIFFYEDKDNSIADTIENGTLVYGKPMDYRD